MYIDLAEDLGHLLLRLERLEDAYSFIRPAASALLHKMKPNIEGSICPD